MPKMCRFPLAGQSCAVSVNPGLVRFVRSTADNRTTIYFDDKTRLVLNEPLNKVESALDAAMNDYEP